MVINKVIINHTNGFRFIYTSDHNHIRLENETIVIDRKRKEKPIKERITEPILT